LGTYETILAVLEPGQQPLPPTTVINTIFLQPPPTFPSTPCPINSTLINGTCVKPSPPPPPTPCLNVTSTTNGTCPPSTIPLPNSTIPLPNSTIPLPNSTIPLPNSTIPLPNSTIPITPPLNATNPILAPGGPDPTGPTNNETEPEEPATCLTSFGPAPAYCNGEPIETCDENTPPGQLCNDEGDPDDCEDGFVDRGSGCVREDEVEEGNNDDVEEEEGGGEELFDGGSEEPEEQEESSTEDASERDSQFD
jgi:hypothetical protein